MADQRAGGIAWTDDTWNPVRGCSRVSAGCMNCYAEAMAGRFSGPGMAYEGLVRQTNQGPRWTGDIAFIEKHLADPLRWRKPRRVFVNSMSDLFHEKVTDEQLDRIFAVMAQAPRHTFQVLTKRPERMREYFHDGRAGAVAAETGSGPDGTRHLPFIRPDDLAARWPLPNVWLGVSVEDQATADARLPHLLETPAAIRWVSYEPALAPVDFAGYDDGSWWTEDGQETDKRLDWIVVGGESGPNARPFDVAWARQTVAQCKEAGVPVFVKQLGSYPILDTRYDRSLSGATRKLVHPRGEDPEEWPEDLRVREFPVPVEVAA